ncbi:PaaI family thioesterase [Pseudomonas sp.]|uniref:PaaI family thioesterase n=1 Tax=Pseudomonas sp. TaxID=306 RepID=UPI003CC5AD5C
MVSKDELQRFFDAEFPHSRFEIESLGERMAVIRKPISGAHLRPGGTVSGPVLMEVADAALYVALLGTLGLVALAVTTNLNINFMRKPRADRDVIAECRLLKVGKTMVIGEVSLYSDGEPEPVAHATGTYAIPPAR